MYRPKYHFTPLQGWINDPNGFIFFEDKYHLFAQHNPYDTKWGPMHWLYKTTKDFLSFKEEGVVLKPSETYDNDLGVWSGNSIINNGIHYVFYTGATNGKQVQCIAYKEKDGNFVKYVKNPVIDESILPDDYLIQDFRDPKVWKHGDYFYCLLACKKKDGSSSLLMYRSNNLFEWTFHSVFYHYNYENSMLECPSYEVIDGKSVLFFSLFKFYFDKNNEKKHLWKNFYIVGDVDYQNGKFITNNEPCLIDEGFDYYAMETTKNKDGNIISIAWMSNMSSDNPSSKEGYVGAMTFPRLLHLKNNKLIQVPFIDFSKIIKKNNMFSNIKSIKLDDLENGYILELSTKNANGLNIDLLKNKFESLKIYVENHHFILDKSKIIIQQNTENMNNSKIVDIPLEDSLLTLKCIVDNSCVEVFLNNGEHALAMYIFSQKDKNSLEISSIFDFDLNVSEF